MSKVDVIVKGCDTCVLKALNCRNYGSVTVCALNKDADTFTCTFGCVPLNCPLIKNDIVVKLKKGVVVGKYSTNSPKPQENK